MSHARAAAVALVAAPVVSLALSLVGVVAPVSDTAVARPPETSIRKATLVFLEPTRPRAPVPAAPPRAPWEPADPALPAGTGEGDRVVFSIGRQQVWLVQADGTVARTYLVSGSRFGQLAPGGYRVFSTSERTVSWHGTETMNLMVRFARGANSAIGFHDIPVRIADGTPVQTLDELGTPLSDGCVRQRAEDAAALWGFAPVGTAVVVTG